MRTMQDCDIHLSWRLLSVSWRLLSVSSESLEEVVYAYLDLNQNNIKLIMNRMKF